MILHNYYRSSSSYRVRIALGLKGLPYDYAPVHLSRDGGGQFAPAFKALNPQSLVPVLQDGEVDVGQSLAILEYLDERYPAAPLLPADIAARAYVRELSLAIACDIHPLSNLRVLRFLEGPMGLGAEQCADWTRHWTRLGLAAIEEKVRRGGRHGKFCLGDMPTMADCCLVPQLFNAKRFAVDLDDFPTLSAIAEACLALEPFRNAHPSVQCDSV